MSNISLLLNSGFDAFSNLYKVKITPPGTEADLPEIRVKDFKAPTLTLGEYDQHFKTASLTRVNAQFTGDREFELVFRIDAKWDLYDSLKAWRKKYLDIGTDSVYLGLNANVNAESVYGDVEVRVFNAVSGLNNGISESDYDASTFWKFKQVILYEITEPSFTRATSAPVEISCKFLFGEYSSTTSTV